jgi:hypothetical protein
MSCCEAVPRRSQVYRNWTKLLTGKANCVDLFPIKKELLKTQAFSFKATTWCMFPVLQRGDDLIIEDAGYDDMQVGDLPAYKGGDHLFTHRIVGKKEIDGKKYLITRPDASKGEGAQGELIPEEEILGKVREVKRGKKTCAQERRTAVLKDKLVYKKENLKDKWHTFCVRTLENIQQFKIYKIIARRIGKSFIYKVKFVISLPMTKSLDIYKHQSIDSITKEDLKSIDFFHILMVLDKQAIGVLTVFKRPVECPHKGLLMSAMFVRRPYRKTGVEEFLVKNTETFLGSKFNENIQRSKTLCEMKTFI